MAKLRMGDVERNENRKNPLIVDSTIDYRGKEGTIVDTDRRLKLPSEDLFAHDFAYLP